MATPERTREAVSVGNDVTQQPIGPSAALIADLLPHRVSFERGWFRTATAICRGGRSDGLAFRQKSACPYPDTRGRGHRRALPHAWLRATL